MDKNKTIKVHQHEQQQQQHAKDHFTFTSLFQDATEPMISSIDNNEPGHFIDNYKDPHHSHTNNDNNSTNNNNNDNNVITSVPISTAAPEPPLHSWFYHVTASKIAQASRRGESRLRQLVLLNNAYGGVFSPSGASANNNTQNSQYEQSQSQFQLQSDPELELEPEPMSLLDSSEPELPSQSQSHHLHHHHPVEQPHQRVSLKRVNEQISNEHHHHHNNPIISDDWRLQAENTWFQEVFDEVIDQDFDGHNNIQQPLDGEGYVNLSLNHHHHYQDNPEDDDDDDYDDEDVDVYNDNEIVDLNNVNQQEHITQHFIFPPSIHPIDNNSPLSSSDNDDDEEAQEEEADSNDSASLSDHTISHNSTSPVTINNSSNHNNSSGNDNDNDDNNNDNSINNNDACCASSSLISCHSSSQIASSLSSLDSASASLPSLQSSSHASPSDSTMSMSVSLGSSSRFSFDSIADNQISPYDDDPPWPAHSYSNFVDNHLPFALDKSLCIDHSHEPLETAQISPSSSSPHYHHHRSHPYSHAHSVVDPIILTSDIDTTISNNLPSPILRHHHHHHHHLPHNTYLSSSSSSPSPSQQSASQSSQPSGSLSVSAYPMLRRKHLDTVDFGPRPANNTRLPLWIQDDLLLKSDYLSSMYYPKSSSPHRRRTVESLTLAYS